MRFEVQVDHFARDEDAMQGDHLIGLVLSRDPSVE